MHKEELGQSKTEQEVKRRVEEHAAVSQKRRTDELQAQANRSKTAPVSGNSDPQGHVLGMVKPFISRPKVTLSARMKNLIINCAKDILACLTYFLTAKFLCWMFLTLVTMYRLGFCQIVYLAI